MTAVEFLKKELEEYGSNSHLSLDWTTFDELIEQAKAMEKQQIMDAVYHNCSSMTHYDLPCGEQYYNETFKSE